MHFSVMQIIGALSYPISLGSLVLGTISWHFHIKETVLQTLTILDRILVFPFFTAIILTKVWVLTDTLNTLHWIADHLSTGYLLMFESNARSMTTYQLD